MYQHFIKRIIDILFSLVILLLISPILLISFLVIKLDSKGPIFFVQERLGMNKKIFNVLKLRTMTHKERIIHKQVFNGNPEVTKVGAFLRRTKIDELPQFINVLKGEMSIVGPRPCLPTISHLFDENTASRFLVRPGVTSLAGVRGSIYLSWPQKWLYDRVYVENLSLWMDIKIIFQSVFVVILGEKRFLKVPENHST